MIEAIERLQTTLYGDPTRDRRGVVERLNSVEAYVMEIREDRKKIIWLLAAGVVGAFLNLVLNVKNTVPSLHSNPPPASAKP